MGGYCSECGNNPCFCDDIKPTRGSMSEPTQEQMDEALKLVNALVNVVAGSILHHELERDGWNYNDECFQRDLLPHVQGVAAILARLAQVEREWDEQKRRADLSAVVVNEKRECISKLEGALRDAIDMIDRLETGGDDAPCDLEVSQVRIAAEKALLAPANRDAEGESK